MNPIYLDKIIKVSVVAGIILVSITFSYILISTTSIKQADFLLSASTKCSAYQDDIKKSVSIVNECTTKKVDGKLVFRSEIEPNLYCEFFEEVFYSPQLNTCVSVIRVGITGNDKSEWSEDYDFNDILRGNQIKSFSVVLGGKKDMEELEKLDEYWRWLKK